MPTNLFDFSGGSNEIINNGSQINAEKDLINEANLINKKVEVPKKNNVIKIDLNYGKEVEEKGNDDFAIDED